MNKLAAVAALAIGLAACGGTDATTEDGPATTAPTSATTETSAEDGGDASAYSDACGEAMAAAAAVDEMQDTVEDTDPAIIACASVEAFAAASADHPDALDGTDVETWLTNRCEFSEDPAVKDSAICAELAG